MIEMICGNSNDGAWSMYNFRVNRIELWTLSFNCTN